MWRQTMTQRDLKHMQKKTSDTHTHTETHTYTNYCLTTKPDTPALFYTSFISHPTQRLTQTVTNNCIM